MPLACPLCAPMTRYGDPMQAPASVVAGTVEAIWSPNIGPGELDTRPVAEAVIEALHEGAVVAATTTDDAGRYELTVHPGTYLIRATAKGPRSPESSRTVTVTAGEPITLRLLLDIGMRCRAGHQPATCPLRTRCRWVKRV
jgi:Carboxypeptidase regulatory-like domain